VGQWAWMGMEESRKLLASIYYGPIVEEIIHSGVEFLSTVSC
jgi:hypothetical protein